MSTAALENIAAALEQLRAQIANLSERVAALEKPAEDREAGLSLSEAPASPAPAPAAAIAPAPPVEEEISQEVLLAISAAIAAYLGKRARVRAVRLLGSTRWSQEGRVSIQASHRLERV
jgi:methylmalonyl-CoA carboxyltransferase large subunit